LRLKGVSLFTKLNRTKDVLLEEFVSLAGIPVARATADVIEKYVSHE